MPDELTAYKKTRPIKLVLFLYTFLWCVLMLHGILFLKKEQLPLELKQLTSRLFQHVREGENPDLLFSIIHAIVKIFMLFLGYLLLMAFCTKWTFSHLLGIVIMLFITSDPVTVTILHDIIEPSLPSKIWCLLAVSQTGLYVFNMMLIDQEATYFASYTLQNNHASRGKGDQSAATESHCMPAAAEIELNSDNSHSKSCVHYLLDIVRSFTCIIWTLTVAVTIVLFEYCLELRVVTLVTVTMNLITVVAVVLLQRRLSAAAQRREVVDLDSPKRNNNNRSSLVVNCFFFKVSCCVLIVYVARCYYCITLVLP